jgi:ferredoxin-fold anticodon binding domain-containing protein
MGFINQLKFKIMNIKKINQNELEELLALTEQLNKRINDYSHVSQHLPKIMLIELHNFYDKLMVEVDRRDELY